MELAEALHFRQARVAALFLVGIECADRDTPQQIIVRLPLRLDAMLENFIFEIGAAAERTTAAAAQAEVRHRQARVHIVRGRHARDGRSAARPIRKGKDVLAEADDRDIVGADQNAMMKPSINGWRTQRYNERSLNGVVDCSRPMRCNHTCFKPNSSKWSITKLLYNTVAQPSRYSVHRTARPSALSTCHTTSGIGRHCQ